MKKLILIQILILIIFANANAQINLTLAFNSRPQQYLADWTNSINGRAIVTVQLGTGNTPTSVKFKTTLTNEAGVTIGVTNVAAARAFTLNPLPATNSFSLGDVLQLESMQFAGQAQSLLQRSGRLQAGAYKITVQILNDVGGVITERVSILNVVSYILPFCITPSNGAELNAKVAASIITFRWTRLAPQEQSLPTYKIQVFEVLNTQTPMQAFRSNAPVLDEVITKGTTQFIWHSNLSMMDTSLNHKFIWTVQTLDDKGMPIPTLDLNQQGRSEPAIFTIVNQSIDREKFVKPTEPK